MNTAETLLTKYRPENFAEVLGNEASVKALHEAIKQPSPPHAYLFTGPSGVGKTTLARIIAKSFDSDIQEIDAASNSGVDYTRQLVELSSYIPVTGKSVMLILDECHMLSKAGWNPLLKLLEDTPKHFYFSLCTTELAKIPDAIKTRCYHVTLKPLKTNEIFDLVSTVASIEKWTVPYDVLSGITQAATGQPRKALTLLQAGRNVNRVDELQTVIANAEMQSEPLVALCKFLMQGGRDWPKIAELLEKLEDDDTSMIAATRYLTASIINSKSEESAKRIWALLDAVTFPRNGYDSKVSLVAAIGAWLWQR